MFTGLIETVGTISKITRQGNYYVLDVTSILNENNLQMGESIACDGVCLTVTSFKKNSFTVQVSQESLEKSIIADYRVGTNLNLERAMKLGDRLGGHLVSGHVDTVGKIDYVKPIGQSLEISVSFDNQFDRYIISKGSIAVNGISLTVNECQSGNLSVNIIPHTSDKTTLKTLKTGDKVNLEFDIFGKYIFNMFKNDKNSSLTIDKLIESGW